MAKAKAPTGIVEGQHPSISTHAIAHSEAAEPHDAPEDVMGAVITDEPEPVGHLDKLVLHDEPECHVEGLQEVRAREGQVDAAVTHDMDDHIVPAEDAQSQQEEPELPDSPSPNKLHNDDLVDLVTMLEAKKPAPEDLIAGEIPDEE